jgi:hypothetical protein
MRETGAIRAVANPATRVSEAPHVTAKLPEDIYARTVALIFFASS